MIHVGKEITSDLNLTADVCVVGSGAGGAVVAATLAEAGLKVIVLEEGGYWPTSAFNEREADMLGALYVGSAMRTTADLLINVLQGRVVGGSTVINMADNTRIPPEVMAHWTKRHQVEEMTPATMEPHFQHVEKIIGTQTILDSELNPNNRKLLEASQRLGWRHHLMNHNRTGCIGAGFCLLGCRYQAKRSADLTFLPNALAAGAEIYADIEVTKLDGDANRVTGAQARVLDRETRQPTGRLVNVKADTVVLCAGAIHTPLLLLRSGLVGKSGQVGKNLSLQPQIFALARFDERLASWRGLPQSVAVDHFENHSDDYGMGGFRIESIFGGPGQASGAMPGLGEEHAKLMQSYPYLASALILCPDQPSGYLEAKGDKVRVHYKFQPALEKTMREGMRRAAEAFLTVGAKEVSYPFTQPTRLAAMSDFPILDQRKIEGGHVLLISAHPQGTCRMGQDPGRAVVDSWGRSHATPNLWIADASTHPTSASSHTMVPIMALARRTAQKMLSTAGK